MTSENILPLSHSNRYSLLNIWGYELNIFCEGCDINQRLLTTQGKAGTPELWQQSPRVLWVHPLLYFQLTWVMD